MNRALFAVVALCAVLSAVLWTRNQAAASVAVADAADAPEPADDGAGSTDPGQWTDEATQAIDGANPFSLIEGSNMQQAASDANSGAFLDVIAHAEGTDKGATDDDQYRVCYGYVHTVQDFARHPAEWYTGADGQRTREWGGESLANLGASYAGKVSTAAGRYQIKLSTWLACKKACALADFSPASQDAAALYLIQGRGALDLVTAGKFDQAIELCAPEWASLPGANYAGQGMRSIESLRAEFADDGGVIVS